MCWDREKSKGKTWKGDTQILTALGRVWERKREAAQMGRKFRVERQVGKRKKTVWSVLSEWVFLCPDFLYVLKTEKIGAFFQSEVSLVALSLVLSISFLPGCEVTQSRLWISKKEFLTFFLFMHKTSIAYLISTEIRATWARAHIMPCFPFS